MWLPYVQVADVSASVAEALRRGGELVQGPRRIGAEQMVVLRDPAGACMALIGPG